MGENRNQILCSAAYVEKGGVGKTTSAAHLGVAAQDEHGLDTVLIDLAGTQNDLATQFGIGDEVRDVDAPISAVFGPHWQQIRDGIPDVVDQMVYETGEGPDLIPADAGLGGADNRLSDEPVEERFSHLDQFIQEELAPRYDFVMLDLPGKEDNIALNGLFAAQHIVTPLKPGEFERDQLHKLQATIEEINDAHDTDLAIRLVFATMVNRATAQHKTFADELQEEFPAIAGATVAKSANVGNQQGQGRTLFATPDDELYDTGRRARDAYRQNATTLIDRIQTHE